MTSCPNFSLLCTGSWFNLRMYNSYYTQMADGGVIAPYFEYCLARFRHSPIHGELWTHTIHAHRFWKRVKGCLHDTGANFLPVRVHSGSLLRLCICLHDTSTKSHTRASHAGASSPRLQFSLLYENSFR